MGAGIDYGMGKSNVDVKTGIRYGVIAQNNVGEALANSDLVYDYGKPTCPKCGNEAVEYDLNKDAKEDGDDFDCAEHECADFMCLACEYVFGGESAFGDEAQGWSYEDDGYSLVDCLDVNVFVLASSFYTLAPFCSPCVPGAGDLDNARDDGVKTYCLGHDWFESGKAPYPVFEVLPGKEIPANT